MCPEYLVNIEKLTTAELESLARRTAVNPIVSAAERSAILRGIQAEISKREAEVRALRGEHSRASVNHDLL
jgi:hypothetical protein